MCGCMCGRCMRLPAPFIIQCHLPFGVTGWGFSTVQFSPPLQAGEVRLQVQSVHEHNSLALCFMPGTYIRRYMQSRHIIVIVARRAQYGLWSRHIIVILARRAQYGLWSRHIIVIVAGGHSMDCEIRGTQFNWCSDASFFPSRINTYME